MKETKEWGEFFPASLSPFGYNETKAQEWFPLSEEEIASRNWPWSDYEQPLPQGLKTIPADSLPNTISAVDDNITEAAVVCEVSERPYRIVSQELQFYRTKGLALPRMAPRERHCNRIARQNPQRLYRDKCKQCSKPIKTCYPPDSNALIYCEECYLHEAY